MSKMLIRTFCVGVAVMLSLGPAPQASAVVSGSMNLANDAGGGIVLSLSLLDFALPVGGGVGSFSTGLGTSLSFSGGVVGPGAAGVIKDITVGGGALPDFITLSAAPNVHFDLTGLGPGVANTAAPNTFNPNDPASSPVAGSPLILTPTSTGTQISFTATGIARDIIAPNSIWTGLFTTQVVGKTPFQIQQTLVAQGSVASTYSASFQVVPEPTTWMLLTSGLICGWALRRKSRQRS